MNTTSRGPKTSSYVVPGAWPTDEETSPDTIATYEPSPYDENTHRRLSYTIVGYKASSPSQGKHRTDERAIRTVSASPARRLRAPRPDEAQGDYGNVDQDPAAPGDGVPTLRGRGHFEEGQHAAGPSARDAATHQKAAPPAFARRGAVTRCRCLLSEDRARKEGSSEAL
ncbi:hypothetical protein NPX13_g6435 [Xylaria arbuscula]|uniref:Uncharacterized protein n=1 Tax=Xylaria arbuscula TaxID=114810 RepID=A0A9W8TKE6_9PEZI|nr:hypothetical protein NPX13_g6435 [Xylaria arbuscula]